MGISLQEQLLKAGLVNQKKAQEIQKQKSKTSKQQRSGQATPQTDEAAREAARKAQEEKAARDRELNRQRQEELRRKELAAQVRQLIMEHRIALAGGEEVYNFADGATLKRLYVTPEIRQGLARERLFIARLEGRYEVVPTAAALRISERDPTALVTQPSAEAKGGEEDDYYAQFEVPDDLMW
jgi:uncharacterized protein